MRSRIVVMSAVLAISFLLLSPSLVAAKKKDGGGDPDPEYYYAGVVKDYDDYDALGNMRLRVMWLNTPYFTSEAGYYSIYPPDPGACSGVIVNYLADDPDYWEQYLYAYLPTIGHIHYLPKRMNNEFYDVLHFANTRYAKFEYPSGWDRHITNYGYQVHPYPYPEYTDNSYHIERSDAIGGSFGSSLAVVSVFQTTGVTCWTYDVAGGYFDIAEAWLPGAQSLAHYVTAPGEDELSPTDPIVTQNLPFGDIWVERGDSMTGTVVESGSTTWDNGEMGEITVGATSYNRKSVPAEITQSSSSGKEFTWTISVPWDDPDSYPGRGGHWFRVFYDGAYSLDSAVNSCGIPYATGITSAHIWCVDSLYSYPGIVFDAPYDESGGLSLISVEEDWWYYPFGGVATAIAPAADVDSGAVTMSKLASATVGVICPSPWAESSSILGFQQCQFTALSSMAMVRADWIMSWYCNADIDDGDFNDAVWGSARLRLVMTVTDVSTGTVNSASMTLFERNDDMDGWRGSETECLHSLQCFISVSVGHTYSVTTYVEFYVHAWGVIGIMVGRTDGYPGQAAIFAGLGVSDDCLLRMLMVTHS